MAGELLAQILNQNKVEPDAYPEILFGKVTSTSPLTIDIEGTQGSYTVDANTFQIILHESVRRKVVTYMYPKITYDMVQPDVTISGSATTEVQGFYLQDITGYDQYYAVTDFTGESWVNRSFIQGIKMQNRLVELSARTSLDLSAKVTQELPTKFVVKDEEREIVVWEDLAVGETVRIIRGKAGNLYYVIGRSE